jgi:general secretion pathway protein G
MVNLSKIRAALRSKPKNRVPRASLLRPGSTAAEDSVSILLIPDPCSLTPELLPDLGFTLLELLIVMLIIATLAAMAIPAYTRNVVAAKEAVLKEDLHVMRNAIDAYTVDKQKAPQALADLVSGGYLKVIPKDPITGRDDTWVTSQSDTLATVDQTDSGIDDVHSGAQQTSIEGTAYNTW